MFSARLRLVLANRSVFGVQELGITRVKRAARISSPMLGKLDGEMYK